jgi:Tfp pilus assembly protein PilN
MQAVNLLPAYARPGHPWAAIGKDLSPRRALAGAGAAAGLIVLGLGFGYVHEHSVVNARSTSLADVQAQVAVADAKAAPLRATQSAAAVRMAAAGTVSARRLQWERLLADMSRVLPSQVYLQSLSLTSPTPLASGAVTTTPAATAPTATTPVGTSGFSATGVASSHVRVALVLDRLALLPWLSGVTLVSTTSGAASGTTGTTSTTGTSATLSAGDTFSVTAGFNPNGGAK